MESLVEAGAAGGLPALPERGIRWLDPSGLDIDKGPGIARFKPGSIPW